MFCNTKDSISAEQKSNVIYSISCPGCFQKYDRNLITRLDEHGTKVDQPIYQHLSNCSAFNDHIMLFTLPDAAADTTIASKELHLHNAVINNVKTLDKNNKSGQLKFLEVSYIIKLAREIKFGLKISKGLQLSD